MGKEPKDSAGKDPAKSEVMAISTVEDLEAQYPQLVADIRSQPNDKVETSEDLEARYPHLVADIRSQAEGKVKTSDDLESFYPDLVSEIKDAVVSDIGNASAKQVKEKLPELYERIVVAVQGRGGANLNVPGFLLALDDPFAQAALTNYQLLKGTDDMRLPCVLPFRDKGKGAIRAEAWKKKYEKTEALKAEFPNVNAYIAFKSKAVIQALESYVLMAGGGGDFERAKAARKAMKKIK